MNHGENTLCAHLLAQARLHDAVAAATTDEGLRLFVYPQGQGALVAVGLPAGRTLRAAALLHRRGSDVRRCGAWLPALFNDGSWYLVRRCSDSEAAALDEDDWALAAELLL
ncbi:hypothetical protein [Massilia sp. NR 4-1]|uniref:hypothetical protein n=1 Tax=Massilia sp. NR 4-1 TaxID=1678028 RepID=UPI00067E5E88|nr:hypothetical protein [Massilia sp. NR 4-1]AKU22912.1 hypothetical protein ACZ75_17015 [Massilia sp. NR 4-1]